MARIDNLRLAQLMFQAFMAGKGYLPHDNYSLRHLEDWANYQPMQALLEPVEAAMAATPDPFLLEVAAELARARAKFHGDNLTTIAMMEEAGEVAKAVLQESPEAIRKECVQLATMAARIALDGDSSTTEYRENRHGLGPVVP